MTNDLRNELLDQGLRDILRLSWVISVVGGHLSKGVGDADVKEQTLGILREMLEAGYFVAGEVAKDDGGVLYVQPWKLSPEGVVNRIASEWRFLAEEHSLGDICWLELTSVGRAMIQSIRAITDDERELIREVVDRRRPELHERITAIGRGELNWKERQMLHVALADELAASGRGKDGMPTDYGRKLESLAERSLVF